MERKRKVAFVYSIEKVSPKDMPNSDDRWMINKGGKKMDLKKKTKL